jgi:glycosyltransferase involved in cell wall biosynthesis
MRILHIIPSLAKGGAERLVLDICNQLSLRKEVEVVLVTFRADNDYAFLSHKINHIVVPSVVNLSVSGKNQFHLDELERLIQNFKPNIIHSHLFEAEMVTRAVLYPHASYFTHCHDNMFQFKKLEPREIFTKTRITETYERNWLIKRYRACQNNFIFISQFIESYFKKSLPADVFERHTLMHNCTDLKNFICNNPLPKEPGCTRLVNCGSFTAIKNQTFLIDVMAELVRYNKNITLDLIGDGPLAENLKQKVAGLNLTDHIFFRGKINDVQTYYCQSDIYVHSAKVESFGLVLLEAMAAGLPVVTLDGLGNRDLMENGKTGYIFQKEDPVAFANAVVGLIENRDQSQVISNHVKELVKKFDVVDYTDRLVQLYKKTIPLD